MRGRADAIVTANVRDYPPDVLGPLQIEIIHPDHFLLDQLDLAPRVVLDVLREQADHTRQPALTPIDLIARLARAGVPGFADEAGRLTGKCMGCSERVGLARQVGCGAEP
ncbi:MAG: hypothetical protein ACRDWN_06740, partial [Acidimicrobiales bacterium]